MWNKEKNSWLDTNVGWVMEFLTYRYKISFILSEKWMAFMEIDTFFLIDITQGTSNWWILSFQSQFPTSKVLIIKNNFLYFFEIEEQLLN